ncbi:MAG TPA: methylmalonyl-CoA epimerase [Phycisphaerales bacterium]|nr:methylmalonyl-CoA epimerase [Phycisphaerales bacterium]
MIDGIDHIAIAVNSLEESLAFYQEALGLSLEGIEEVKEQKVRVALLKVGQTRIELLEPTSEDSPISSFLAKRGPGLHHIALATTQLQSRLDKLDSEGVKLIDRVAKIGAEGKQIAFVHPKASGGVLMELCAEAAE